MVMKCKILIGTAVTALLLLAPVIKVSAQDNGARRGSLQRDIYGNQPKQGKAVNRKPVSVKRSKKEQEKKIKKDNRDYEKFVRKSRKHAIEIQSPEVKERMKNNRKDADSKYREKRRKDAENSRKAGKKYK